MRRFIVLSLLIVATVALGQSDDYIIAEAQKNRCSDGGQSEMNACLSKEFQKVDKTLNTLYSKLVSVLVHPEGIVKAQRAWLKYRDAECSPETFGMEEAGGGSIYLYALYACRLEYTEERIRHLRWHLAQDCNGCPPRK